MADNDVEIRFGADTAGVEEGADQVKVEINALQASFDGLTATLKSVGASATESFAQMKEGALTASETVKGLAESISEFREAITGIGEALLAAFAVEQLIEFSKHMGEAGEQVEHAAVRLGTSIGTVQQLNAAFELMGVAPEKGISAIGRLDRAAVAAKEGAKQQLAAFRELGITVINTGDQMKLLGDVMDGFQKMADGPQKVAVAMRLLGRAGAELIPFLNLGRAGLAELIRVTDQYGVKNTEAAEAAAQLGSAWNENKVANKGLSEVLAQAFAPAMTVAVQGMNSLIASWIKSYKEGGLVHQVIDDLVNAFKVSIQVVVVLGTMLDAAFKLGSAAVQSFDGIWQAVGDATIGMIHDLEAQFMALGRIIYDALSGNVMAGARDMARAMRESSQRATELGQKIAADLKKPVDDLSAAWRSVQKDAAAATAFNENLMAGKPRHQMNTVETKEGDADGVPEGKTKKPKDDAVAKWREELEAQEVASGEFFKDQTQAELTFWQSKLALTASGSKDWLEVQKAIFQASKTLAHQDYEEHLADLNDRLQADKNNWAKEQADWQEKLSYLKGKFTEESAEYKNAHREMEAAERQHQLEMTRIARENTTEALAELKSNLDTAKTIREADARQAESSLRDRAKYGGPTAEISADKQIAAMHQQMLAQQMAADLAYHTQADRLLDEEIATALKNDGEGSDAYVKAVNTKKLADLQFANQNKMLSDQMVNQAKADADKIRADWHKSIDPMVSTTGDQIKGLIEGTETWGQALRNIGESAISAVIAQIERLIDEWIVSMIIGKAATATAGQGSVASYAGIAGAAGVASMAGAPFPMDLYAPAFGASMAAAAMAFGTLASAAGGYDIPGGVNPLTQLHSEEMVLPASIANPLRASLAGGSALGAGGGGGDYHAHFSPTIYGGNRESTEEMLNRIMPEFTKRTIKMHRIGKLK